ncbi:LysR family transcriptional regulator [Nocardioides sp. KR10-350]|uniref:LysR family transcriptional regulator n=1 Tax=Nocardioides cheoyonin TaxID=3156615 RepID=UPI0032B41D29
MERRQLEFFLAIAEAGGFTRAAGRLNIAQPSLSYAIRVLEKELGATLFERHGRGVRLTAAGEALVRPAQQALRGFALAEVAVRASSEGGFGRVVIVGNTLWAIDPLVGIVSTFRRLQPAVQFVVRDPVSRSDALDQVRSGAADLALVDGTPPGGALTSRRLAEHELVAVLPPAERGNLPEEGATSVAALVELGLVSTPRGTPMRELLDRALEEAGAAPEIAVETAHTATVVPLVLAGAGAAVLPEGMAAEAAAKGARIARLDPPTRASVSLVWRSGRLSEVARQVLLVAGDGMSAGDSTGGR